MDQVKMSKQMIDLQKNTFDSMIKNMLFYLDSMETMSKGFLDQTPWMPEEGKRALTEWIKKQQERT